MPTRLVVFTDLDGTLLDAKTYSHAAAKEALAELERRGVPVVFCTSKTRAEVEALQRKLGSAQPFITENGGGIFLPSGYFPQRIEGARRVGRYLCLALAQPYAEIVAALEEISETAGASIVGFHQMSAREIAQNTGLTLRQAELARQREFDEPFFFAGASEQRIQKFLHAAKVCGVELARGGRFWHAFASSDKGRAVQKLLKLYRAATRSRWRSVALGDSANDLPMLAAVDWPVLLPKGGQFDKEVLRHLLRVQRGVAPGPAGWNQAVLNLLARAEAAPGRGGAR